MTDDEVWQAARICQEAFGFLVDERGYLPTGPQFASDGFRLRYAGPGIGVQVDWYPREPLTVWLVKLEHGTFPERTMVTGPDSKPNYYDLEDLEALSGHARQVGELQLYALPDEANSRLLADSLRTYGGDTLRGDLARLPELERRILTRARTVAIEHYGVQGARQLGW